MQHEYERLKNQLDDKRTKTSVAWSEKYKDIMQAYALEVSTFEADD